MKPIHTLPVLILAGSLAFTGCDNKPTVADGPGKPAAQVSEADAIANFKKEVEGIVKWEEDSKKTTPPNDPAAGMAMMTAMIAKFQAVSTNGLPADLKGPWGEFTGVLGELGTLVKGMPKISKDKPDDGMKAMMEMLPKMMELQTKVEPIVKKLSEVGKKYGLDALDKVGPGK